MLLALLFGVGVAAGLDAEPMRVTPDNLAEELDRLEALGHVSIAIVAEDSDAEAAVRPLTLRARADVDRASCVLRVAGRGGHLEAWLSGACLGDSLVLSTHTLARFQRVAVGSVMEPPPPVLPREPAPVTGLRHPKRSKLGTRLLLISGGIVGASYAWYQLEDKVVGNTTGAEWGAMVGLNTLGWVGLAGGGAAVVSARF